MRASSINLCQCAILWPAEAGQPTLKPISVMSSCATQTQGGMEKWKCKNVKLNVKKNKKTNKRDLEEMLQQQVSSHKKKLFSEVDVCRFLTRASTCGFKDDESSAISQILTTIYNFNNWVMWSKYIWVGGGLYSFIRFVDRIKCLRKLETFLFLTGRTNIVHRCWHSCWHSCYGAGSFSRTWLTVR